MLQAWYGNNAIPAQELAMTIYAVKRVDNFISIVAFMDDENGEILSYEQWYGSTATRHWKRSNHTVVQLIDDGYYTNAHLESIKDNLLRDHYRRNRGRVGASVRNDADISVDIAIIKWVSRLNEI